MTAVQLALCEPTWDPDPDDEDDGPYCRLRDLRGQGLTAIQMHTITDIQLASQEYL